jgi:trehalose 6-phosphate synthase
VSRLVVVSNRVILPSERIQRAGGLAVAIREALGRSGGLWFGWSGELNEAPEATTQTASKGKMEFAVFDLTPSEFDGFYNNFANSTLWPLFHYRIGLVKFSRAAFQTYLAVNGRFAEMLIPHLKPDDTIWIHDYQLLPLAGELRKRGVANKIGFFLHIPLPGVDTLAVLPGLNTLMRGLAAADVMYWEVMRRAAQDRGATMFDFGRSKADTGAFAFKKNWGFEPEQLHYCYRLAPGAKVPDNNPNNPKYRYLIAAWKRLPLAVANVIGPRLVRGLG